MALSGEIFAPYVVVFPVGSSLDFAVFRASARRVFVNGVWGYRPEYQRSRSWPISRPCSATIFASRSRSEERNASRPEPLLGDLDQLLERNFAGIAEELD